MTYSHHEFFSCLKSPVIQANVDDVMDMTSVTTLRLIVERPFDLSDYPDLPIRLRGALGRALHENKGSVSANKRILVRPSAFDCLFGQHGEYISGFPFPSPFGIYCEPQGSLLKIDIHLLGVAEFYSEEVLLTMAQTMETGIALASDKPLRTCLTIVDMGLTKQYPFARRVKGDCAVLKFATPLQLRANSHQTLSSAALLHSSVIRFAALSRWCGFETGNLWSELKTKAAEVSVNTDKMIQVRWTRHSIRQKGVSIPMSGFVGSYAITQGANQFIEYLRFGEFFGVGSKANLGMGGYGLAIYPY